MKQRHYQLIRRIAGRAIKLYERLGQEPPAISILTMELTIVHDEIVPLRLQELLEADDGNFAHDIGGIRRHLEPGSPVLRPRLKGGFMPRFAVTEREAPGGK